MSRIKEDSKILSLSTTDTTGNRIMTQKIGGDFYFNARFISEKYGKKKL